MTERWDGRWPDTQTDFPAKGERIRYTRKLSHSDRREEGFARVELVWCGVEPVIALDSGISIYPCLGDTWERVPV
jgi:hypothetical protein